VQLTHKYKRCNSKLVCYTALFDDAAFRGGDAGRDALEGLGAAALVEERLWLEVDGSLVETTASIQIADTGCCVGEIPVARRFCAGTFGVVPSGVKLCTTRAVVGSGEGLDDEMRVAWASSAGRMGVARSWRITAGLCSSRIRSAASVGFPLASSHGSHSMVSSLESADFVLGAMQRWPWPFRGATAAPCGKRRFSIDQLPLLVLDGNRLLVFNLVACASCESELGNPRH
jgi:hypothetical protein